jgi:hypothetical protein
MAGNQDGPATALGGAAGNAHMVASEESVGH